MNLDLAASSDWTRLKRWLARCGPWLGALVFSWPLYLGVAEERAALLRLEQVEARPAPPAAFALDDAYIYQVYARNLARGEGYAFNAGRPDSAATSLLWALVLAPLHLQNAVDPLVATKILGALCAFLACGFLGLAVARWTNSSLAGSISAIALALTPRLAWSALSGMDPPLTMALVAAGLCAARTNKPRTLALMLFGLAGFSRPEAFLLLPLAALAAWCALLLSRRNASNADDRAALWRLSWRCLLLTSGVVLCYAGANAFLAGDPLPSTFRAKVGPASLIDVLSGKAALSDIVMRMAELPWKLWFFLWQDRGILVIPALLGLIWCRPSRREPLRCFLPLLLVAYPLAKELLAPSFNDLLFQHGRQAALLSLVGAAGLGASIALVPRLCWPFVAAFLLHLTPLLAILWCLFPPVVGIEAQAAFRTAVQNEVQQLWPWLAWAIVPALAMSLALWFAQRWSLRSAAYALTLALFGAGTLHSLQQAPNRAQEQGTDVLRIAHMHVGTGRWLAENTPVTARIGANDIGAIGYYSERKIIDLFGLLDAGILRFRRHASGGVGSTHAERSDLHAAFLNEPAFACDYLALFPDWFPSLLAEMVQAEPGAPALDGASLFQVEVPPNPTTGSTLKLVFKVRR